MGSAASVAVSNDDRISKTRGIELLGDDWDEDAWATVALDKDELVPGHVWNAKVAEYSERVSRAPRSVPLAKGRRPGLSDRDLTNECWYFTVGQLVNPACLVAFDVHPKSSVPAELLGGRRFRLAFTAHDAVAAGRPLPLEGKASGSGSFYNADGDDDSIDDHEVVTPYNHEDTAPLEWDYWDNSGDGDAQGVREPGVGPLHGVLHKVSLDDLPRIDAVVEGLVAGRSSQLEATQSTDAATALSSGGPVRVKTNVKLYTDLGAGLWISCWMHQIVEGPGELAAAKRASGSIPGPPSPPLSPVAEDLSSSSSSALRVPARQGSGLYRFPETATGSSPGLIFAAGVVDAASTGAAHPPSSLAGASIPRSEGGEEKESSPVQPTQGAPGAPVASDGVGTRVVPEERLIQAIVQGLVRHGVDSGYVDSLRQLEALPRTPLEQLASFQRRVGAWGESLATQREDGSSRDSGKGAPGGGVAGNSSGLQQPLPVWGMAEVRHAHAAARAKGGFVTCCNGKVLAYDPEVMAVSAGNEAEAGASTPAARARLLPDPLVVRLSALVGARDLEVAACREKYDPRYGVEDDARKMTEEHRRVLEDLLARSPLGPCLVVVAWHQQHEFGEERAAGSAGNSGGEAADQAAPLVGSVAHHASFRVVVHEVD